MKAAEQAREQRGQFEMGDRLRRLLCCVRFPSSFPLTSLQREHACVLLETLHSLDVLPSPKSMVFVLARQAK